MCSSCNGIYGGIGRSSEVGCKTDTFTCGCRGCGLGIIGSLAKGFTCTAFRIVRGIDRSIFRCK